MADSPSPDAPMRRRRRGAVPLDSDADTPSPRSNLDGIPQHYQTSSPIGALAPTSISESPPLVKKKPVSRTADSEQSLRQKVSTPVKRFLTVLSPTLRSAFEIIKAVVGAFLEFWNERVDVQRSTVQVAGITFLFTTVLHGLLTHQASRTINNDLDDILDWNIRLLEENAKLRGVLGYNFTKDAKLDELHSSLNLSSLFAPLFTLAVSTLFLALFYKEYRRAEPQITSGQSTWKEYLAYRIDFYFSSTVAAKPLLLLGLTFLLVLSGALCYWSVAGGSFGSAMWVAWTFVASPGSHAAVQGGLSRFVSLMISLGGMLVFALVIGIVAESIGDKVDSLKKGRSRVIENGHTLILGWSDKTLPVISEICEANRSDGGKPIVVLAEQDKQEMEEKIKMINTAGSTVICRSGSPISQADLKKVSATTARSIVVLSEPGADADEMDARVVRVVLSVTGLGPKLGHVVVEMCDVDNKELVYLVGGDDVEIMVTHDIIGRLMIQSARQPGLAQVLEGLLGFEGSEFYLKEWPELFGKSFQEIAFRFDDAVPLGIKPTDGPAMLNPPLNRIYQPGEELLVLAEDDDSYDVNEGCAEGVNAVDLPKDVSARSGSECMLFCGWRRDMGDMIAELDSSVPKGSFLWIMSQVPLANREARMEEGGRKGIQGIVNLTLVHRQGNPTLRRDLELLPLETFDSVLILADEEVDMQSADSRSLATLLLVRDIQRERYANMPKRPRNKSFLTRKNSVAINDSDMSARISELLPETAVRVQEPVLLDTCVLISEVLDPRTRALISVANVSDFVMSNEIISAAIAQVAEQREINAVLQELLSAAGNETYVRDARFYARLPGEYSFWQMASQAQKRGEVAIGFKKVSDDNATLNPVNKAEVFQWVPGDTLIVISQT